MTTSPGRPLVVDWQGNMLASFTPGTEHSPPEDAPLPAALVALWRGACVLMVFDRFRQQWELPGGGIEPGETPRQAALRELLDRKSTRLNSSHIPLSRMPS